MIDKNEQTQKVGSNAIAIMAARDVNVHQGLTYSDVRDIAADVYEGRFLKLSGDAAELAGQRARMIIEQYIEQLQQQNPVGVEQAADVDFQHALYGVQRDYARTGDEDLASLLVDLLVDRSKATQRTLMQIVLNESLVTAPKLTPQQVAALGLVFLLRYTQNSQVASVPTIGDYLDKFVKPLIDGFSLTTSSVQHMEFAGCGTIGMTGASIQLLFATTYKGLFTRGFERAQITIVNPSPQFNSMIIACTRDPLRLQVSARSDEVLETVIKERNISDEEAVHLRSLFSVGMMSEDEIKASLIEQRDYMGPLMEAWVSTSLMNFTLTSVGMAIGHASIKRHAGEFADLAIWIN